MVEVAGPLHQMKLTPLHSTTYYNVVYQ